MNTGSKRGNSSFGFGSFMTFALVCFSVAGCDPSEKQVKKEAEQKAKEVNNTQSEVLKSKLLGPTGIGSVSIGMSKSEYVSAIGINPVDCNTAKDKDGKPKRSEMKYLTPDEKTLCWLNAFEKRGSTENIQLGGISYDVVQANYESSKIVQSIGNSSKAIFVKDRLVSIEIYAPEVTLDTLTMKYGTPNLLDKTKVEVCKNRIGNEFKNQVGTIDAIWNNGEVNAILRTKLNPPRQTCTDGFNMQYYIIEERRQLEPIEAAITNFRNEIAKKTAKDSPF